MLRNKEEIRKFAEEVATIIAKERPDLEPKVGLMAKAGTTLTAIAFIKKEHAEGSISPQLYVEHFLDDEGVNDANEIARRMLVTYDNSIADIFANNPIERAANIYKSILPTDKIKDHLEVRLVSKSLSRELVENGPSRKFVNDLYIVPYLSLIEMEDGSKYCARFTYEMLKESIFETEGELIDAALICAENKDKIYEEPMPPYIYLITNESKMYGASGICYKGVLDDVFEDVGRENFYILPTSVHEVLVVPESKADIKDLYMMVFTANSDPSAVRPEDVLSYNVYHYNGETKELTCPTANMGVADQMQYMYSRATGILN